MELGALGADLDSEDLVAKRAIKARVKHFSEQLRKVNLKDGDSAVSALCQARPLSFSFLSFSLSLFISFSLSLFLSFFLSLFLSFSLSLTHTLSCVLSLTSSFAVT